MRIIDAHVHLYPNEISHAPAAWAAAHGERHWAALCTRIRRDGRPVQAFPSVDALLRAMDAAGVERVVLQGWYWENFANCAAQNRFYDECVRTHPSRLAACATLHPHAGREATLAEIRRAADAGFAGLGELSPHSQGFSNEDATWRDALALAGDLKLPVNLHVTEPEGKNYPGKIATPLDDFVRLAEAHRATTLVLAHWGARLPLHAELGARVRKLENVFYDTAASPLIYSPPVIGEMIAALGPERVIFGSDFPLFLYPHAPATEPGAMRRFIDEFATAGLSDEALAALMSGNAARIFRL
jgi:predicted TIM-barrel fold metal-dependent hydrolase